MIDGYDIVGSIIIAAKNVTIKNTKLTSTTPWHAIRVMEDATGFTLMDSEINGDGSTVNGVLGHGTFLRNEIYNVENGLNIWGTSNVQDNYIHGLRGGPQAHFDGIEINGGSNIRIVHNTVINESNQTSAIMLDNYFTGLSNITVDNNRLVGGGYTVYLDDRFGGGFVDDASIRITNNQIGGGSYGNFSIYDNRPIMSGNVGLDEIPPSGGGTGGGGTGGGGTGGGQQPTYTGTAGDDVLPRTGQSTAGNENYYGMGGNDVINGGAGGDRLDGGSGRDTASYSGSSAGVVIDLAAGTASGGHAAGDRLVGIENLTGCGAADSLSGNGDANTLDGGAGNDTLSGAGGNDTLLGGSGADRMRGGGGNDVYYVDQSGDVVDESVSGSGGVDIILSSVSLDLRSALGSVENLTLTGSANINATGNSLANAFNGNDGVNSLAGWSGNDLLNGGGGNDRLSGGSGDDILNGNSGSDRLIGGSGRDTFLFDTAPGRYGTDVIEDFSPVDDTIQLDNAVFTALGAAGRLSNAAFTANAAGVARDANDRIIYETDTGWLSYDYNGSAAGGNVRFAQLSPNLSSLSSHDFVVV